MAFISFTTAVRAILTLHSSTVPKRAARSPILKNPIRTGFVEAKPAIKGVPSFTETIERHLVHASLSTNCQSDALRGWFRDFERIQPSSRCVGECVQYSVLKTPRKRGRRYQTIVFKRSWQRAQSTSPKEHRHSDRLVVDSPSTRIQYNIFQPKVYQSHSTRGLIENNCLLADWYYNTLRPVKQR